VGHAVRHSIPWMNLLKCNNSCFHVGNPRLPRRCRPCINALRPASKLLPRQFVAVECNLMVLSAYIVSSGLSPLTTEFEPHVLTLTFIPFTSSCVSVLYRCVRWGLVSSPICPFPNTSPLYCTFHSAHLHPKPPVPVWCPRIFYNLAAAALGFLHHTDINLLAV
jgi:hypothetical protein